MIPVGLHAFTIKPTLPAELDHLYLTNIHAHGAVFDVMLEHGGWRVIRSDGTVLACGNYGEVKEVRV